MTKSSILGALTIIGGIVTCAINYFTTGHLDYMSAVPAITGGWGLLHAKDKSQTGVIK